MKKLNLLAFLLAASICPIRAQIISDFSNFTPSWYSPGWDESVAESGPSSFAIGNFGNGQPVDDGGFGVWLGEAGLDWSGYTHIYLTGVAVAGLAPNVATSFNFFLIDADFNTAIVTFDMSDFTTQTEVGRSIEWSGVDATRITDWGIGTSMSGTDDFAFTFDRASFTSVPEPSSALLLVGGMVLALGGRWRRRKPNTALSASPPFVLLGSSRPLKQ